MSRAASVVVILFLSSLAHADEDLLHQWQLDSAHFKENKVAPLASKLEGTIVGPVRFDRNEPKALLLDGNSKAKHRIDITDDLKKAGLPERQISVEAWVRIDRPQEWTAMAGAFQDNGLLKKGWLLGFHQSRFFFAVCGKNNYQLTYLHARTSFQMGFWYHVVGTYDGREQRLYVDGKLEALSKEQSGDIDYPKRAFYTLGAYRDDNELYTIKGSLESVSVFSKALTTEQVEARFKERKSRFPDIETYRPSVTDWPTWQRDNLRTGITTENLTLPLRLAWVHKARHAPSPAWPEEAKADYYHNKYQLPERVIFDRAFHVVGVGDRAYFASSSENKLTCLDASTGRTLWTFLTEGPMRLAPTVVEDRILAGSDDGFVYCLRARDGVLLWKQRIGPGPRRIPGNERMVSVWPIRTDVLVEDGKCHVCAGVFPSQGAYQATLSLEDGKVLENRKIGVTAQGYLERHLGQLHVATGRDPAGAFVAKLKRLGKEVGKEISALPADYPFSFIGAREVRIGGGAGKLAAFRTLDGTKVWSETVEGRVFSLAVVRGRLLASTDAGHVYCFTSDAGDARTHEPPAPVEPDYPDTKMKARYTEAATWIARLHPQRGYCLVLGSADGRLALELAKRTSWQIVGVEPDAARAERSRRLIDSAGLAHRVAIHQGSLDPLPYGDCVFNVVVSDSLDGEGRFTGSRPEALRVTRPSGGVTVFGLTEKEIERRGALVGAGEWTHMYGDPGNSACSGDTRVDTELQLQWFGPPGPRTMIDRHHRTSSPLYSKGLVFVPGEDRVLAQDAYNGTILWDINIPNSRRISAFRDSSQLALAELLHVAASDRCLALDPLTGKTERTYVVPANKGEKLEWGYVARAGDYLVGSGVKHGSIRRSQSNKQSVTETHWDFAPAVGSDVLFAYRCNSDRPAWTYRPAGLILNPTLTIANDRVYFIEGGNPATLKKPLARVKLQEALGDGSTMTALDLRTGKVIWSKSGHRFDLLEHNVFVSHAKGCLVVVGSRNSGTDPKKSTLLYDVRVFDAATGELKWWKTQDQRQPIGCDHGEQERHPVIVGDKLYCEPVAYNLLTGERIEWKWPWTEKTRRGCGTLSASASCVFFRDDHIALFDLDKNRPQKVTAETRPGCWINLLPVGGLLLVPEASSGCTCNFSVQTSLALIPIKNRP